MRLALAIGLTALFCIPVAAAAGFVLNHPGTRTQTRTEKVTVPQVVHASTPGLTVAHMFDGIKADQLSRAQAPDGTTYVCGAYKGGDWLITGLCIREGTGA